LRKEKDGLTGEPILADVRVMAEFGDDADSSEVIESMESSRAN